MPLPPAGGQHPFGLADAERTRTVLTEAGFRDIDFESVDAPMVFGADPDDAEQFVLGLLGWMLDGANADTIGQATAALRHALRAHATDEGVVFGSRAWIIRARRAA